MDKPRRPEVGDGISALWGRLVSDNIRAYGSIGGNGLDVMDMPSGKTMSLQTTWGSTVVTGYNDTHILTIQPYSMVKLGGLIGRGNAIVHDISRSDVSCYSNVGATLGPIPYHSTGPVVVGGAFIARCFDTPATPGRNVGAECAIERGAYWLRPAMGGNFMIAAVLDQAQLTWLPYDNMVVVTPKGFGILMGAGAGNENYPPEPIGTFAVKGDFAVTYPADGRTVITVA